MFGYLSVIFLLVISSYAFFNNTNSQNFGPYQYDILKFETCKGPKKTDCGTVKLKNTKNMSDLPFVLDFPADCPVTKAKITIGTVNEQNRTKAMWNYQLNKPCQHFVLGALISQVFNSSRNCVIDKGHYEISINLVDLTTKFLGTSFFYDTYFFKSVAYNNKNNFFCTYSMIKMFKL